jgi:hypothetical protein
MNDGVDELAKLTGKTWRPRSSDKTNDHLRTRPFLLLLFFFLNSFSHNLEPEHTKAEGYY